MSFEQTVAEAFRRVDASWGVESLKSAFDRIALAAAQAAEQMRSWGSYLQQPGLLATLRRQAGGAGDPDSADWQCGPCTGWLHEWCSGPITQCRCTCQGGHLR